MKFPVYKIQIQLVNVHFSCINTVLKVLNLIAKGGRKEKLAFLLYIYVFEA